MKVTQDAPINQSNIFEDITSDFLNQGYSQEEAESMASNYVESN